eukprot:CAMPEP_0172755228 /NCGR_PEP_ID=MMETSP1074-20121228/159460_1 /TAXON_ID=2916 /ORGANISM="Ceratium fusus, Strain PA161109" /LENGTH=64 /DNA_ID=CAMNT_0013588283 /DNA_START=663 /DNA_END=857 /DNA_ORIENTATION=+
MWPLKPSSRSNPTSPSMLQELSLVPPAMLQRQGGKLLRHGPACQHHFRGVGATTNAATSAASEV